MKIIEKVIASLNEIGHGKKEVQFAFVDAETGNTITPFCRCKDYFNDMIWSHRTGKSASIYGFSWKKGQDNGVLDRPSFTIAVRLRDKISHEVLDVESKHITSIRIFLNRFERKLKFPTCKATVCDDNKNIILTVSKNWSNVPYTLSALFMFIRLGFTYNTKLQPLSFFSNASSSDFISPSDESYYKSINSRIKDLYEGKIDTRQTFEKITSSSDAHNHSGLRDYQAYKID